MKLRNMKTSLSLILTGMIALASLENVSAGDESDKKSLETAQLGPTGLGKDKAVTEEWTRREHPEPFKGKGDWYTVSKKEGDKIEIRERKTGETLLLDKGRKEITGNNLVFADGIVRSLNLAELKGIKIEAEIEPYYIQDFQKFGLNPDSDSQESWRISTEGAEIRKLLDVCLKVRYENASQNGMSLEGLPTPIKALSLTGINPEIVKKVEKSFKDEKFQESVKRTKDFYENFAPSASGTGKEFLAALEDYQKARPGVYDIGEGKKLSFHPGKSILFDKRNHIVYFEDPQNFETFIGFTEVRKMDVMPGIVYGGAIGGGVAEFQKHPILALYPSIELENGMTAMLLPQKKEDRDAALSILSNYSQTFYYTAILKEWHEDFVDNVIESDDIISGGPLREEHNRFKIGRA